MSTDSMPIPSWPEVQAAIEAQRRRQEEQHKELSTINLLRGAGVAMMTVGFFGGAVLLSVALADEHLDRMRHLANPYATLLTIGGLVMFVASILYGANRRHHDDLATRIAKLERRGSYQEGRRPQRPRRKPSQTTDGTAGGTVVPLPSPETIQALRRLARKTSRARPTEDKPEDTTG